MHCLMTLLLQHRIESWLEVQLAQMNLCVTEIIEGDSIWPCNVFCMKCLLFAPIHICTKQCGNSSTIVCPEHQSETSNMVLFKLTDILLSFYTRCTCSHCVMRYMLPLRDADVIYDKWCWCLARFPIIVYFFFYFSKALTYNKLSVKWTGKM